MIVVIVASQRVPFRLLIRSAGGENLIEYQQAERSTPHHEFLIGMRDQLPLLLAVVPFGLIFGALALSVGIPPLAAQGFSLFVFAGSAQFIAAGLIGKGTPAAVVAVTILIVNLRHVLYSANMAPHFRRLPRRWKLTLSWLLTDEAFAMAFTRYRRSTSGHPQWYTLGTGMTLWVAWQISTSVGIALGARVPETLSLDFAVPLTFLALLVPTLRDRPSWAAAISAGLLAVLLAGLPYRLGLILSTLIGVGIALAFEALDHPPAHQRGKHDV